MSIERTYYCDGPDCGGDGGLKRGQTSFHAATATPPPYLPQGFLEVRQGGPTEEVWHFCGWDCAMKYGATIPPPEVIEL